MTQFNRFMAFLALAMIMDMALLVMTHLPSPQKEPRSVSAF